PLLAEVARIAEYSFPDELTEAFVDLGAESVETLLAMRADSHDAPDVAFALAGLGVRDQRILDLLLERFRAEPAEGALELGLYGDPAARPELEKALEEAGSDERLRQELETALDDIGREDSTRPEPFDIFPLYPSEESPYFASFDNKELLEFLKSPVAAYRASAVKMLTFEEMPAEIVRTVFDIARQDPDPHVRAMAWEGLEEVHEPPEIEQALHDKLADETASPEERSAALVALAHEAEDNEELRQRISMFFADPATRARAVKAMWHSGDRRFEKSVVQALDDAELEVRKQAMTAVGILGMVAQIGRLEQVFDDEELRDAALYAYALAAPSASTPAHLRKLFRRIEDLAGALSDEEALIVSKALDDRLEANGYEPIFFNQEAWEQNEHAEAPAPEAPAAAPAKAGRNDPCPCGSGKKFKKCCGA
ncbi:MAG TPA: HEAT repeat domain-containing protein, partial [Bryobacteraceae bacterium]